MREKLTYPITIFVFWGFFGVAVLFASYLVSFPAGVSAETATTTLTITICGNGIVESVETCDDITNLGSYASSIATRQCAPGCSAYGPYCGDSILQASFAESCDDGNNASGDFCSDVCVAEAVPPPEPQPSKPPGFSPGSGIAPTPTKVTIIGKAYPSSDVNVLKDGEVVGVVKADSKGDFLFSTTNVTPGVVTFSFWAQDQIGLRSIAFTMTFTVVPNAVTTVSGAYLPPTIDIDKRKMKRGEIVNIFGQTVPSVEVFTHVASEHEVIEKSESDTGGKWGIPFDTSVLEGDDFHTAKAMFEAIVSGNVVKSGFSQTVAFFVGERDIQPADFCGRSDINKDGRVSLVDFSILVFYWGSSNGDADINIDGKVGLTDFSIMLSCWTG